MEEKVLKQNGTIKIEGEDIPVTDLDISNKPEIKPLPKEALKKQLDKLNNDPVQKANNVVTVEKNNHIEKKNYLFWKILAIILLVLIAIGIIWANNSFTKIANKDLKPQITVEPAQVNVQTNVTTPISNNYTIVNNNNISITFDRSFLEMILNMLNYTNST